MKSKCCNSDILFAGTLNGNGKSICSKCGKELRLEDITIEDFVPMNTAHIIGLKKEDYIQDEPDELEEKEMEEKKRMYDLGFKAGQESNKDILEENRIIKEDFEEGREIMGLSKWKEYGKRMGFWDYFEDEIKTSTIKEIADKEVDCELKGYNLGKSEERKQIKKDLLKIADEGEIEELRVNVKEYFK
jgi:hypothetical protein